MSTIITKANGNRALPFSPERLTGFINQVFESRGLSDLEGKQEYIDKVIRSIESNEEIDATEITDRLIRNAADKIKSTSPKWVEIASELFLLKLYKQASINRAYDVSKKYGDYLGLQKKLASIGTYSKDILKSYSEEEIKLAGTFIQPELDKKFSYVGLETFNASYLAKDYNLNTYELPQERFLTIALYIMQKEDKSKRMELVKEAYWALSNLYMVTATPTLNNAGKNGGQLSSCFISSIEDSLTGIYQNNSDVAQLSKNGGGIGVYASFVRAKGSDIRNHKGVSSGVIPWIKQLNNTAVSVDQVGQRNGAIAVYLDVWHLDILSFLDLRLNNGDERQRAHDVFTGVCLPDLFMEQVEKRGDWYLFCPHDVKKKTGISLPDLYDEVKGNGSFRNTYWELVDNPELQKLRVPAIDIFKRIMRSQLETGVPYMFYKDEANRQNPNKHKGLIYCSNLCSEIMENISNGKYSEDYEVVVLKDGSRQIVKKYIAGDHVVCNLSSIHLANVVRDNVLERVIKIQVRMLDNVIDLNNLPIADAQVTNHIYRAIGLGTMSWHELLAVKGIKWESEEAVNYADELYERIAYHSIKSSNDLAIEKGQYEYFEGSEWHTGTYFERKGYKSHDDLDWDTLKESVKQNGMRNSYLMATAPTGRISLIANSTAGIDPIYSRQYVEEKKTYRAPVVAPSLDSETFWFYQAAHEVDQLWSIKQNAARQKHIDQGQSFNLYVKNTIKAIDLLNLHLEAWKSGLKSTYYVRSTSVEVEECDSCQ